MANQRLNLPTVTRNPDGNVSADDLDRLLRVLMDWSRNVGMAIDELEHPAPSGGIGT